MQLLKNVQFNKMLYLRYMKNKLIIIILFLFANKLYAVDNSSLFIKANDLYKNGRYDTAIILYNDILKSGVESSELYFNIGNAYFKKKDISNAILNYERAHKLAPGDDDINFNLQLAQTMIVDKINILPEFFLLSWLRNFRELFSTDAWAKISITLFIFVLIITGIYLYTNRLWLKKISFWLGIVFIVFSIMALYNSYSTKKAIESQSWAIVMTPSVTIKSSPDEDGTDLFVIHEGTKVWINDKVENWLKIRIADGNNGWIKKTDIEAI